MLGARLKMTLNDKGRSAIPAGLLDALVSPDPEHPRKFEALCAEGQTCSFVIFDDRDDGDASRFSRLLLYNNTVWDRLLGEYTQKVERIERNRMIKAIRAEHPDYDEFDIEDAIDEGALGQIVDSRVRTITSRVDTCKVDGQARFTIPADMRKSAGLEVPEKEVMDVYYVPVRDKIELWAAEALGKEREPVPGGFRH